MTAGWRAHTIASSTSVLTSGAVTHAYCWSDPCCSLASNALCGVDKEGRGTFATEGITALFEGIKQCKTLVSLR